MSLSVKVVSLKKMDLARLSSSYKDALNSAIKESVLKVHSDAVKSIRKISQGRKVKRRGKLHTVSKPGDPPNVDTGRLIQSIQFQIDELGHVGAVGSNLKYASWLEFGTQKMAARPWLKPASDKNRNSIRNSFRREVKRRKKT